MLTKPMLTKSMSTNGNRFAIGAALAFGILAAASTAQAANENVGSGEEGGIKFGPLGQCFVCNMPRYTWRSWGGRHAYAYVPGWRYRHREWKYER